MVFIHDLVEEIVYIYLGACIHYCLKLVDQFTKFKTLALSKFFQVNLAVDAVDY